MDKEFEIQTKDLGIRVKQQELFCYHSPSIYRSTGFRLTYCLSPLDHATLRNLKKATYRRKTSLSLKQFSFLKLAVSDWMKIPCTHAFLLFVIFE